MTHSRQLEQVKPEDRRADEGLKESLKFERLLFDLSARFVNIAPDQVDLEINNALRQILEFFYYPAIFCKGIVTKNGVIRV